MGITPESKPSQNLVLLIHLNFHTSMLIFMSFVMLFISSFKFLTLDTHECYLHTFIFLLSLYVLSSLCLPFLLIVQLLLF